MDKVFFRKASKDDVDEVYETILSAFGVDEGSERARHYRSIASDWKNIVVLELEDKIIGVAHIARYVLWYGISEFVKGDVGYVSIRREFQGKGYGTFLMDKVVRYMENDGFHISRLGGLIRFYSRFGYVPFPRRYYVFPLEVVYAGAMKITPPEYLAISHKDEINIRKYDATKDYDHVYRLIESFNRGRIGALKNEKPSKLTASESKSFVYEDNGVITAYLHTYIYDREAVLMGAFDFNHRRTFTVLLKEVLKELYHRGIRNVKGRFPFDRVMEDIFNKNGIYFVKSELFSYPASNMLLIVNLNGFMKSILPELKRRVEEETEGWHGTIECNVGNDKVFFKVDGYDIEILDGDTKISDRITLDPQDFLLMILGYRSFKEVYTTGNVSRKLYSFLDGLFSRQSVATGQLG